MLLHRKRPTAFTLIELLVVISIIIILMGLLFPAFKGVQDQAKRTQAKNDLSQLVTAVTAFYTEYGLYPIPSNLVGDNSQPDFTYDEGNSNATLMKILTGKDDVTNPKKIAFMQPSPARQQGAYGLQSDDRFFDPWGSQYRTRIDINYDNQVRDPVNDSNLLTLGVLAWSPGKDKIHVYNSPTDPANEDNVYSYK